MIYKNPKDLLSQMVTIVPTDEPILTCYFSMNDLYHFKKQLDVTVKNYSKQATPLQVESLRISCDKIMQWIKQFRLTDQKAVAIYCRTSDHDSFFDLSYVNADLKSEVMISESPVLYPLFELMDRYDHFIVLMTNQEWARILEVHMGQLEKQMLHKNEFKIHDWGKKTTKMHYQNRKRERDQRFIQEKVEIVKSLFKEHPHYKLIIAGLPERVARVKKALPQDIQEKVVSEMSVNHKMSYDDIVNQALNLFQAYEEQESLNTAEHLVQESYATSLAIVGLKSVERACRQGNLEKLVISQVFPDTHVKERLIKQAFLQGAEIETVPDGSLLEPYGSVGAFLRFKPSYDDEVDSEAFPCAI